MQRLFVRIRKHRNGFDTHFTRSLDDAAGDFTAVGDKDLVKHERSFFHSLAEYSKKAM
jgi:hypothetical protein